MQAGFGSAGAGGGIILNGHSKAIVDNLVPDKAIQRKIIDDREIFTAKKAESLLKGQEVPTLDISLDSLPGMFSAQSDQWMMMENPLVSLLIVFGWMATWILYYISH